MCTITLGRFDFFFSFSSLPQGGLAAVWMTRTMAIFFGYISVLPISSFLMNAYQLWYMHPVPGYVGSIPPPPHFWL